MALDQLSRQASKRGTVGLISGIRVMAKRDVKIGCDQQGQSHNPQGRTTFLAVTALGQGTPLVKRIDERKEIGGIEQDLVDIHSELANQVGGEIAFDGDDGVWGNAVHLVPEALTGQLFGTEIQEASQRRALVPGRDLDLAARIEAAIEGGDEQVMADAGAAWPTSGGDVTVDELDQAEALGQIVQGDRRPEFGDHRLLGGRADRGRRSSQSGDDLVGAAKVLLPDDLGPAVDSTAFARVVVGLTVDSFLDEAGHTVGHTAKAA